MNSVLTQNQDFTAFQTAKEHIKLSEQVVRNQSKFNYLISVKKSTIFNNIFLLSVKQLKTKRAELVADPGNASLRRQM